MTVDCFRERNLATPFGGYRQSAFGGRDNGVHALDQYTQLKTLWIRVSDRELGAAVEQGHGTRPTTLGAGTTR